MLTLYQPRRSQSDDASSSEGEAIIPAGRPYLTKVNGRLVMARDKRDKPAETAVDILGEAFRGGTRVIRRRASSLGRETTPLIIGGIPYVPLQQQQLTYTAPLPQQVFPPSVISIPQYPQLLQNPPAFTVQNPTPTKKEFEQLTRIDAHFNKIDTEKRPGSGEMQSSEGMASRTIITITKHICANCRRLRSKKYHLDNPIKPGDNPAPVFCRKCQRDASSTGDSNSDRGPRSTKQNNSKKDKGKKKQKKTVEYSSESESTVVPEPKTIRRRTSKKKWTRSIPEEDYIVVEEEYSDQEQERGRRGRPYRRERDEVIVEEYEDYRRPLSPWNRERIRARSQSTGRLDRFDIPKTSRRRRHREYLQRPPSSQYRYVEASESIRHVERVEETYPRRVPIHFEDEDAAYAPSIQSKSSATDYDKPPQRPHYEREERVEQRRPSRVSASVVEDSYGAPFSSKSFRENMIYVERRPVSKENSFDDTETVSSIRSHEAAQRRRKERISPTEPTFRPWKQPYLIQPRHADEVVVVTERYEHRPKRGPKLDEEERRRQEYLERKTLDTGSRRTQFSAREEAARYYNEDWTRSESVPRQEAPAPRKERKRRGYRRDRYQDSELAESEASYRCPSPEQYDPPRAPTPPSPPISSDIQQWTEGAPYPIGSDSEVPQRHHKSRKGKAVQRDASLEQASRPHRSISMPRPAYVQKVTDGGTEKAIMPSPIQSRSRSRERQREEYEVEEYEDSMISGLTERERAAEAEVRHVTFRDDLSQRSSDGGWATTKSVRPESEGGETGGGGAW